MRPMVMKAVSGIARAAMPKGAEAKPVPPPPDMTSTMRWLILLPAGPGALLGGWIGEHIGLRAALAFAGVAALALAAAAALLSSLPQVRRLPQPAARVPFEALDDATT